MRKLLFILSMIPFIGSLVVVNRVEPYVLGMPFVLFWAAMWVVLTTVFLLISNLLYSANDRGKNN